MAAVGRADRRVRRSCAVDRVAPRPLASGAWVAVGALGAWAGWVEPRRLVIRELETTIGSWPADLDGLRLAVVGDFHVGSPHVDAPRVERIAERINALSADLVCLLGDYLSEDMWLGRRVAAGAACEPLGRLRAPLGVYAVLGDHDWELDAAGVALTLREAGIRVLEDEAAVAGDHGLWIAGVSRAWRPESDAAAALGGVPPHAPAIVLAHSPDVFPSLSDDVALTLAGHTHGGQIGIPALTRRMIPSRYGTRYLGGLYREGAKQLLVHTGVGTSRIPVRFLVPPQITTITIRTSRP